MVLYHNLHKLLQLLPNNVFSGSFIGGSNVTITSGSGNITISSSGGGSVPASEQLVVPRK